MLTREYLTIVNLSAESDKHEVFAFTLQLA